MAILQWCDDFSVNVAEIDQQHKIVLQIINDLTDALRARKGNDIIGRIIGYLVQYSQGHFAFEEKYFDQFGYPDSDNHKKEHVEFTDAVLKYRDYYDNNQLGLSLDILVFLSKWWANHVQVTDKKYGPFLNEHGIK